MEAGGEGGGGVGGEAGAEGGGGGQPAAEGHALVDRDVVERCKLNPAVTHSLKPPGFNLCTYEV
jgi:hypothetical protein